MSGPTTELTEDELLARARSGDTAAFDTLVAPLRRQLHAHCYRMLGSGHDADDALQDALLRAWRGLSGFAGRSSLRSWLYTLATNTCLDAVAGRGRRALPVDHGAPSERVVLDNRPRTDVAWLGPYPSVRVDGPDTRAEQREGVELAFVAALQHLPGNQRAALLLFDVLDFSAAEIATMMATSVGSVTSALQRARATVEQKVPPRSTAPAADDARIRELVAGFASALERGDAEAMVAMLTADVTWSMPPLPHWFRGIDAVMDFVVRVPMTGCGSWRHVPTTANDQPAVACYLWDDTARAHVAWSIDVLTLAGDRIADVTAFIGAEHFAAFGLPASVD